MTWSLRVPGYLVPSTAREVRHGELLVKAGTWIVGDNHSAGRPLGYQIIMIASAIFVLATIWD